MNDAPAALAIAAHPDDIEFMMAGTLLRLRDAGWQIHYMNIANGSCGTAVDPPEVIIPKRTAEAQAACARVGAVYHESVCDDLAVYYTPDLVARVAAVVREVRPRILLVPSPQDYMEDHVNAGRLAVTAAFVRGMRNFNTRPSRPPVPDDVTVYHALPYGLCTPLRQRIRPGQYVDITPVLPEKRAMLACHRSQKEWLDQSQGLDAYLDTMEDFAREVGRMSGKFPFAEGWRRRLHLGFSGEDADPLAEVLGPSCWVDPEYEAERARPRFL